MAAENLSANAPLEEVAVGFGFREVPEWQGDLPFKLTSLLQHEFPVAQVVQPLAPLESEPIKFMLGAPKTVSAGGARLWFASQDGAWLLQCQADRLHLNWRNRNAASPYPGHQVLFKKFIEFQQRIHTEFSNYGGLDRLQAVELLYVDHFLPGRLWSDPGDLTGLFRNMNTPPAAFRNAQIHEFTVLGPTVRDEADESTVTLSLTADTRVNMHELTNKLIRAQYRAIGRLASKDQDALKRWCERAHDLILGCFCESLTEEALKEYGMKEICKNGCQ